MSSPLIFLFTRQNFGPNLSDTTRVSLRPQQRRDCILLTSFKQKTFQVSFAYLQTAHEASGYFDSTLTIIATLDGGD